MYNKHSLILCLFIQRALGCQLGLALLASCILTDILDAAAESVIKQIR